MDEQVLEVGSYGLSHNGSPVPFWPLMPGMKQVYLLDRSDPAEHPETTEERPVQTGRRNPLRVGDYTVFDILVLLPPEAPVFPANPSFATAPPLPVQVAGRAPQNSAELFATKAKRGRICFAVSIRRDATFDATLHVTVRTVGTSPASQRADVPLRMSLDHRHGTADDLVLLHAMAPSRQDYTWVQLQAFDHATSAPVPGAHAQVSLLRDNQVIRDYNRECALETLTNGHIGTQDQRDHVPDGRFTVGLPLNWPLLFKLSKHTHVLRSRMLRFANNLKKDNRNPHVSPPIRMVSTADARLVNTVDESTTPMTVLLDPGHGVFYAYVPARRPYEWYVAHRIADRMATILAERHSARVLLTRTAGIALIRPTMHGTQRLLRDTADSDTDNRFSYDMENRRIWARRSTTLRDLTDVLLTRYQLRADGYTFEAIDTPAAQRRSIIEDAHNTVALDLLTARRNAGLGGNRAVVPGSLDWDQGRDTYVWDIGPTPGSAGPSTTEEVAVAANSLSAATTADGRGLHVGPELLRNIADATACWAWSFRIGRSTNADSWWGRVRTAMSRAIEGEGALAYMKRKCYEQSAPDQLGAGHVFLQRGLKGWSPATRRDYFNATDCEVYISLHHNGHSLGGSARGVTMLKATAPTSAGNLRHAKTFLKYITGFRGGLHGSGIASAAGPVGLLGQLNQRLDRYGYFELEFMDTRATDGKNTYGYEQMLDAEERLIERTAEEASAAVVELLLAPQDQTEFDAAHLYGHTTSGTVRW